jgi:hypothetical protein
VTSRTTEPRRCPLRPLSTYTGWATTQPLTACHPNAVAAGFGPTAHSLRPEHARARPKLGHSHSGQSRAAGPLLSAQGGFVTASHEMRAPAR